MVVVDVDQERVESQARLETTLENIYRKYDKDFEEEADVVDLDTMTIVVDKGHLKRLNQDDVEDEFSTEEESSGENVEKLLASGKKVEKDIKKKRKPSLELHNQSLRVSPPKPVQDEQCMPVCRKVFCFRCCHC